MTDPTPRPPLWEVMEQARDGVIAAQHPFAREEHCLAAEIRAVAKWIEERQAEDYACTLPDMREVVGWLEDEADRAERADG